MNSETSSIQHCWCRTGDKPLSEPVLTQLTEGYMQHYGEMHRKYHKMSIALFYKRLKELIPSLRSWLWCPKQAISLAQIKYLTMTMIEYDILSQDH